jgi:hypothetical protein
MVRVEGSDFLAGAATAEEGSKSVMPHSTLMDGGKSAVFRAGYSFGDPIIRGFVGTMHL